MLDLKFIRENPDLVKQGIQAKGEPNKVDELLLLDGKRRDLIQRSERLKAKRNSFWLRSGPSPSRR